MIKVLTVKALSEYRLAIEFSDGTSGIADLSSHINRKPFLVLCNEKLFQNVVVEYGSVEWAESNVGIATEALYALVHKVHFEQK